MKWKFTSDKILINGITLLVLAIVLIIAVTLYQSRKEVSTSKLVDETQQAILNTEKIYTAARALETGSRAYLLTGDPDFLQTYLNAKKDFKSLASELKALAADTHSSQTLIDSMVSFANRRILFADSTTGLKKDIGFQLALQIVASGKGKIYLDDIRRISGAMQQYEINLLKQRKKDKEAVTSNEQQIIIAIAWIILAAMLLLFLKDRQNTRKKEQEKISGILKKSEERFRVLSSNIKDYTFTMLDTNGRVISWNSDEENSTDTETENIIGKSFEIFYTKEDIEKGEPARCLKKAREYGQYENESYYVGKDGSIFWAQVIFTALTDDGGKLYGYSSIARDITERKKIQEQLEMLSFQINQSNDAIYTTDAYRKIISWNKGAENLYGYAKEEMTGNEPNATLKTVISELETDAILKEIARKHYWTGEIKRKTKAGKDIWVRSSSSAIRDDKGVITGYVSVSFDITEQKKLQDEVNHLTNMVEQSSEAIISIGLDQRIISWNKGAEKLHGYSKAEAIGKAASALGLIHLPDDEIKEAVHQVVEKGVWKTEMNFFRKDGSSFFGAVTANLIKNEKGESTSFYFGVKDISIRKQLEKQLKKYNEELEIKVKERTEQVYHSEKKYRYLFENNPLPMWVIDAVTFKFLDVNEMAIQHYGYTREEFLKMTALDIRPAEDKNNFLQIDRSSQAVAAINNMGIWNHLKKDGTVIQVEINSHRVTFENNKATLILANDVTERMNATEKLAFSEKRFRALIENNYDIITLLDASFKVFYRSPSAARITGWSDEEMMISDGKNKISIHPDDWERAEIIMKECIAKPGKPIYATYRNLHKNGHYIWLEGAVTNLLHHKYVNAIVFNFRDITQRVEAEEKVTASEIRFRSLIENISDGIVLNDADSNILYQSPSVTRILGYTPEERKEKKVIDYIHPDNQHDFIKLYNDLQNIPNVPLSFQYRFLHKNGQYIWLEGVVTNLLQNPAVKAYVANYRDVTERKETEKKIKNINAELEEKVIKRTEQLKKSNEELEAFSYSVSHDLRAPLRAIIGFSAILEEDYATKLDDEAKRITTVIKSNTVKMGQLIDDLLNFSRMGRQELIKVPINNNNIVAEIKQEMESHQAAGKNIRWVIHDLPYTVGDINSIRQVWINYISNAVKYSAKNEAPVIEIDSLKKEGQIIFFVKDNGVGFDEKYAIKLFKVFQRLHSTDDFEGTGVGLAIVEKIVSKHGGNVWANATLNKGATFYFSLPVN